VARVLSLIMILHSKPLAARIFMDGRPSLQGRVLYIRTRLQNVRLQRLAPLSDAASMPAIGPSRCRLGETLARIMAHKRPSTTLRGSRMENSITSNLPKNAQALADKAADKAQGGIRDAQQAAKDAGSTLSSKVEELRSDTGSALTKAVDRVQSMGK
jgi:hypothetical protein